MAVRGVHVCRIPVRSGDWKESWSNDRTLTTIYTLQQTISSEKKKDNCYDSEPEIRAQLAKLPANVNRLGHPMRNLKRQFQMNRYMIP